MGPAAAAQVGMDAMNAALNPGSSATSALGAVGRENEVQNAQVMASAMVVAITPLVDQVKILGTGVIVAQKDVNDVKRKLEKHVIEFKQNKKQLTEQKKLCATLKKRLEFHDRDAERFNTEYAANWEELDQHVARINAEQNALKAENEDLRARMDKFEKAAATGAPAARFEGAVPQASVPPRASVPSGASGASGAAAMHKATMRNLPILGAVEVYADEGLAFDKGGMRYIARDHNTKCSYRMQLRSEKGQIANFQSNSLHELKQLRVKWCQQYPLSPPAKKAKNIYSNLLFAEDQVPASQPNTAAPEAGRVSSLATLACAARVLVESRAKSGGKRT